MSQKVEVNAEAIRTIVRFFGTRQTIAPDVVKGALVELTQALNQVPVEGCAFLEGFRVKPKPGRNYLRAGERAYDEAMIVQRTPLVVISMDGRHIWKGLSEDLFDVYNRMSGSLHDRLIIAYDNYINKKED